MMDLLNIIVLIHIFVGFILVYFASRAFKRSKYTPMLYLASGFLLITIGDTIVGDYLNIVNTSYNKEVA